MDFSSVESYCDSKFKKEFGSLPFEQQLKVNKQYLQEKPQGHILEDVRYIRHIPPTATNKIFVESPSKSSDLLSNRLATFSLASHPLSVNCAFENPFTGYATLTDEGGYGGFPYFTRVDDYFCEASYYPSLTKWVPSNLKHEDIHPIASDKRTLLKLFPSIEECSVFLTLPLRCEPEVFVSVEPLSCQPPYTAEGKSFGDGTKVVDELLVYCLGGLYESFFSSDTEKLLRVYPSPPVAFALAAAGYMAHHVLVEWVGELRMSPISKPFFLRSAEHEAAAKEIQSFSQSPEYATRYSNALNLSMEGQWITDTKHGISYRDDGQAFWKIMRPRPGLDCSNVYLVYKKYEELCTREVLPRQLVPAKLYFGQFILAVWMPSVGDRLATSEEMINIDSTVLSDVAVAMVWLACRGLFYSDLCNLNVRVNGASSQAFLVDYDDIVLTTPLDTFDDFLGFMRTQIAIPAVRVNLELDVILAAIRNEYLK